MDRCVIFCAGGFDELLAPIGEKDYVIAADGGFIHTQQLNISPDCILGDFDSLGYVPENGQVSPVEKDDTDTMLAIRHGLEQGYQKFFLYGALEGKRLDHTVANFQTLQFLADRNAQGYLIGKDHIVTLIKNSSLRFSAEAEGILSVFCLGADAQGVTLDGLQYTLYNSTLTAGFPLGVSNHFVGKPATVSVLNGSLLVIFSRENACNCEDLL